MNRCKYKGLFIRYLLIACLLQPGFFFQLHGQEVEHTDTITKAFYDTLRVRAQKRYLSGLLYDIVVIAPSTAENARDALKNTNQFDDFEGKLIRHLTVIRLDVFGTNIDDPTEKSPSRADKILNSTYSKTRNFVIRKYLLFNEGDTVSALRMADNERLLRSLPYIDDARITIIPVSDETADVAIIIREKYPYGFDFSLSDLSVGKVRLFDNNFAGLGQDLEFSFPYNFDKYPYPGFGTKYTVRNIARSFADLELDFSDGLGSTRMGGLFGRDFISSETKYAWSASIRLTYTTEDLDTMDVPSQLRYTFQDYWAARSFMLDRSNVTRLIFTGRYMHNNVFRRPEIEDNEYYRLQNYKLMTGSIALSSQRFINTSLIYSYGRTEDIPYGYMLEAVGGLEINEFKRRQYLGLKASYGNIFTKLGYIYAGFSYSTFYNDGNTEQGLTNLSIRYFTPLIQTGRSKIRTFVNIYHTRGFNRYRDEYLYLKNDDYIRGFRNDSISGNNRIVLSVEPVLLTPRSLIGFRFAIFAFADAGFLINGKVNSGDYQNVSAVGAGVRIRNDRLVLNTIQIRFAFYPNSPPYSETSFFSIDGVSRLRPPDFDPDPPGVPSYR